ncbi:MAG TPA: hypothetical protein VFR23_20525 [Jiangellaceae bacterium]|nr:hypothetical protein [Jiangellaceae bacterium]
MSPAPEPHLADDLLRDAFVTPQFEGRLRPVMAMEEFANFRPGPR